MLRVPCWVEMEAVAKATVSKSAKINGSELPFCSKGMFGHQWKMSLNKTECPHSSIILKI